MININMETKDGVILNTNGKYCEDYIQVTPTNADTITAQNIKEGVTILGVEGTLAEDNTSFNELISLTRPWASEQTPFTTQIASDGRTLQAIERPIFNNVAPDTKTTFTGQYIINNFPAVEKGQIERSYAWYAATSGLTETDYTIEGTYELIGDFCTINATVTTIPNWGVVYYTLPTPALPGTKSCIISTNDNDNKVYFIRTATIESNNSVIAITTFTGEPMSVKENVTFTLRYKYK